MTSRGAGVLKGWSEERKKRLRVALFAFSYSMWLLGVLLSWRSEQPIGVISLTLAFWSSYLFYRIFPPED